MSASMIVVVGLFVLIAVNGLSHFWPKPVAQFEYRSADQQTVTLIGEVRDRETVTTERVMQSGEWLADTSAASQERLLLKIGNRERFGLDFRWALNANITGTAYPEELLVIERQEWGNFYGFLQSVEVGEVTPGDDAAVGDDTEIRLVLAKSIQRALAIRSQIHYIERDQIGRINYAMERLRLRQRQLELDDKLTDNAQQKLTAEREQLDGEYAGLQQSLVGLYQQVNRDKLVMIDSTGEQAIIAVGAVVRAYYPNSFGVGDKLGFYAEKLWEFVADDPREANTEGGIFPAIFGTVIMVLVMAVLVTPFGVLAAVYLREYAKQGLFTQMIRVAVNNLAGVPSIVYGVFGLGFFVYFLGGNIDQLFFPEALPAPTFGTPGLLWASLTLALLSLPVVIVSTEEGLSRVPSAVREGSLALGATKAETLWRVVLPMASPAMMTGMILAVARAAGEVAPLMLVGVVKLAPSLPLDFNAPFLHLDRKFMHMGFHIYDVGFQSPNVEAARPLVYATALMLVVVIVVMNLTAIRIRNNLREKYRALEN